MNRKQAPLTDVSPAMCQNLSRRRFVRTGLVGVAGALVGFRASSTSALPVLQTTLSPDAALNELLEGNRRYVSGSMTAQKQDVHALQADTAEKQEPFAAVLSCADSRVPVELIFDQTIGRLFVCRVAGNVTTPEIIASLEYGAAVLGARVILVLGHSNCGAVAAAMKNSDVPGQISVLYPHIRPAIDLAGPHAAAATKANAKMHATLLAEASTAISSLVKENKIKVVAGYYDLKNGVVTLC